jgi:hypothetical protein
MVSRRPVDSIRGRSFGSVHDVDHAGVPKHNSCQGKLKISALYKGRSVAEQNSVDLSWDLLMDESYGI